MRDLLALVGVLLVAVGVGLIYLPASLICAGLLMLVALAATRPKPAPAPRVEA